MKKKLLIFISVFIAFIININTAHAAVGDNIVCTYGTRDGDDSSTWEQRFVINVSGAYNSVHIDGAKSQFLQDEFDVAVTEFKEVNEEQYNYEGDIVHPGIKANDYVRIYLSMYPNETVYKNLDGGCPPVLKGKFYIESAITGKDINHYVIFNDDLDKKDIENAFWYDLKEDNIRDFTLIEEGNKDKSNSELVDDYNCITYSSSIEEMKKAIQESDSKSCDDNAEFTRIYQDLSAVCESYRSTSMYTKDDGGNIVAQACNKACSMLNDDIALICKDESAQFGSCGSLGKESTQWLFRLVRIVRYAVPALLVILSILDFIKAIASESEDEMKKATGKFTKRLVAAVLLFLIPFILDFILAIFDIPGLDPTNPFCAN